MTTPERSVEEIVSTFMSTWFRPAYFEAWTPANRQEQVLHDEAKLKWETCKKELTQTLKAERQRCDQELQKARHDWLREEIVKLEGMKQEIPTYLNKRGHHTNSAHRKIKYNQALDEIIHRYQSELDQPNK